MDNKHESLTIVLPAYNETDVLPKLLPGLLDYSQKRGWKMIVVNDGSTDDTKEVLETFSENDSLTVINHKVNRGYGGAIISGIEESSTEYTITLDADGQHYIEDAEKLLNVIIDRDADMIIGSRKEHKSGSYFRSFGKFIIRTLAKMLMPLKIYDINSGMKIYRTEIAQQYLHLYPSSMAFSDIIALVFISNKHLVLEEPIRIKPRQGGISTINIQTAFETVMEIINIVILFHPMKIFLPISILIFVVGVCWSLRFIILGGGISVASNLLLVTALLIFLLGLVTEQLSEIRRNLHK